MQQWAEYCLNTTGMLLPINDIRMQGTAGALMHSVPDGEPPLLIQGTPCRQLAMTYELQAIGANDLN